MIRTLSISNFRSIGEGVVISLDRLTALVGPNGSGKSNIGDALRFISEALRLGLESAMTRRGGIQAIRRWSGGRPFDITIKLDWEAETDDCGGSYEVILASVGDSDDGHVVKQESAECWIGAYRYGFSIKDGIWVEGPQGIRPKINKQALALPLLAGDERFLPLADALKNIAIYSIFPDTLRSPQKPDFTRPMQEHGGNWASILKTLKNENLSNDLVEALGKVTGDVDLFRVMPAAGLLVPQFRHGKSGRRDIERWFDAASESDGTLRVAGILTALLQDPPLTLIGIEEPELTIHPGAIPLLYDHLLEASQREQVMITTHSPEFLNLWNVDGIRVVARQEGITTVAPLDPAQRATVRDRLLTLGDLIRMEPLRQEHAGTFS